jgi:lipopolysaccharide/colanic/teichoic acid biosynthesis glycosyltransferase
MLRKRVFDVVVAVSASVVLLPIMGICCLAILISAGRPVFYTSPRRVDTNRVLRLRKFRTMVRNADKVANRDTVSVTDTGTRFLNVSTTSSLYTPIGRIIERCQFTELPQTLYVLTGTLSIIGSRPLPENVVATLREAHDNVDDRFLTPAGLAGPVQMIGRDNLSDEDRLRIEARYCKIALNNYSVRLDLLILLRTVLAASRLRSAYTVAEVDQMLSRFERAGDVAADSRYKVA